MNKIGFFGGCFNPPTNIHMNIAKKLIDEGKLDKVIFVPVNDYYKKNDLIEAKYRYEMLKIATKNYNNIDVDDIEIKANKNLYAAQAFEMIEKSMPNIQMFLIMGSDNYNKMHTWKDYNKIKDKYHYIVVERDEKEVSSTQIRSMIKNNDKRVLEYLSKEVYDFIIKNNLYMM